MAAVSNRPTALYSGSHTHTAPGETDLIPDRQNVSPSAVEGKIASRRDKETLAILATLSENVLGIVILEVVATYTSGSVHP